NADEPQLELATPAQLAQRKKFDANVKRLESDLNKETPELAAAQNAWEQKELGDKTELAKAPEKVRNALAVEAGKRTDKEKRVIVDHFRSIAPELKSIRDELAAARKSEKDVKGQIPTTLVMEERAKPRETHVFTRGNFLNPAELVSPGVPAVLPSLP